MYSAFLRQPVIIDLDAPYLAIGTLVAVDDDSVTLADCDLHDHREANSTKEVYAIESRQLGVRANRRQVVIPRERIVAVSLLADVTG
jgi:hypothetical protein